MDSIEALAKYEISWAIIHLTAYSDEESWERARMTEPYGYIIKPFKR